MERLFVDLLSASNETLTAAIVVIAASMLLYNLTRNLRNRVARTSGIVLACVTATYIGDVFIALGPSARTYAATLRLQWIGIAFIPAAMFHLSDALLETTGLPSRGRRRRVARILYLIGATFLVAAAFTDILIQPVFVGASASQRPGFLFWIYVLYFLLAISVAFVNVQRARQRCLTRSTRRRMGYLQIAMLTPPLGIFPYSLLLGVGEELSLTALVLVNVANVVVVLMLLFLAYPLSFFGTRIPDRVVKAELLHFMLRGPGTALMALGVIIFLTPATRVLSLPGDAFMPFAVVTVVLLWQWIVAIALPWLEKRLIYFGEDDEQMQKLQSLSDRLLTTGDLLQLIEAILAAICDYIRVNTAFLVAFGEDGPEVIRSIGQGGLTGGIFSENVQELETRFATNGVGNLKLHPWDSLWIIPLYSRRTSEQQLMGYIGIEARSTEVDLSADDSQILESLVRRAARTLDDIRLQAEINAALEGLLPQYSTTRARAAEVEFKRGRQPIGGNGTLDREQIIAQVRAALRHYWGGAGLTSSRLQELYVVRKAMPENDNNSMRALRAVLLTAIEKQKPDGPRKMTSPEWTIYNILDLRFVERLRVRDVAIKTAHSEPDLYRKQRVAIEAVADTIIEMEQEQIQAEQDARSSAESLGQSAQSL